MHELITGFVGLDAHAESTAIAVAEAGRAAPRFIGTVGPRLSELTKALSKLGDNYAWSSKSRRVTSNIIPARVLGGQGGVFADHRTLESLAHSTC
jgi:hypothetical protein